METHPPPLVHRKWLLCTLACFLGYLLLSYSLEKAFRPSTTIVSFPGFHGPAKLTLSGDAEAPSENYVDVSPPSEAVMSPRPTTEAEMVSPQPSAAVVENYVDVSPPSEAAMSPPPTAEAELVSPQPSAVVEMATSAESPSIPLLPQQSTSQVIDEEILTAKAAGAARNPEADGGEVGKVVEKKCDIFDGRWVYDRQRYPLYRSHWCPFLSDQVSCQRNGRPDSDYEHWRWQPNGCDLPWFNGKDMLERWRGKRVVIVGDSLNRNMWESLACILYSSVRRNRAYVKWHGSEYKVFRALDYDCSVEFFWSPFLVELKEREDHAKILRVDKLPESANRWLGADVMVFNTGHWWTHRGKMRAWNYFERREQLTEAMEANEAFNRALRTWARWVDGSVDPAKTTVFFRSVSPEHKRENLHWCYNETHPITHQRYVQLFPRSMVELVERTIRKMRTPVTYLNITRLSEYRRDAHTAVYTSKQGKLLTAGQRQEPARYADCSHWCLPGLPDTWNVLLFASFIGTPTIPS
ncbi:unnamed protein product [Musa acuminata subsp. malaccensis]|uniref:(wild Malaysian banana) hypothetical protein n=1 Tax=Musa acuminata subsp. malaccensis TaxID=214687 RepID=A0A804IMI4_MUSAM|nr:PREDICTED: protein trichome birefringence-like 42 [Musa acuminata subsp. malaccensis]CAG1841590.1 unnamed protein product [Musa acuminata subsp. malaccensis]